MYKNDRCIVDDKDKNGMMMGWENYGQANRCGLMCQNRLKLSKRREEMQRKSLRVHDSVIKQESAGVYCDKQDRLQRRYRGRKHSMV